MREYIFKGFHECENGTDSAFYNDKWHTGIWMQSNSIISLKGENGKDDLYMIQPHDVSCFAEEGDVNMDIIIDIHGLNALKVVTETVCEFTGLYDRNETPVFENDILDYYGESGPVVYYEEDGMYYLNLNNVLCGFGDIDSKSCEVVGNKFNPQEPDIFDEYGVCELSVKEFLNCPPEENTFAVHIENGQWTALLAMEYWENCPDENRQPYRVLGYIRPFTGPYEWILDKEIIKNKSLNEATLTKHDEMAGGIIFFGEEDCDLPEGSNVHALLLNLLTEEKFYDRLKIFSMEESDFKEMVNKYEVPDGLYIFRFPGKEVQV